MKKKKLISSALAFSTALLSRQVVAQTCYTDGTTLYPHIMARNYLTTSTPQQVGSVVNLRSCENDTGLSYMAVLYTYDYSQSWSQDNRMNLVIYDWNAGDGQNAVTMIVQTYNGSWDSSKTDTALFFDPQCSAVGWSYYDNSSDSLKVFRHELPLDCTSDADTACYSTLAIEPFKQHSDQRMGDVPREVFQFDNASNNIFLSRYDQGELDNQSFAFEFTLPVSGIQVVPALNDNISTSGTRSRDLYWEQRKSYAVTSSVMVSETELMFAGVSYDTAVFGGYDLMSGTDARTLTFEQYIQIGYPVSDYGVTKPSILRKFLNGSTIQLYVVYENTQGVGIVRWTASMNLGLQRDGAHAGVGWDKSSTNDRVLDLYVESYGKVTMMMSDATPTDRSAITIVQFDIDLQEARSRSVSVWDSGSYIGVNAGTLNGPNSGYFGGVTTQLGYKNNARDTCTADTVLYKYPQLYGQTTSPSTYRFGFLQTITAADSCLPFDDSYGDWVDVGYVEEGGSVVQLSSADGDYQSVEENIYTYKINSEDRWMLIPGEDFTQDMAWCPENNDGITLTSTLESQIWEPSNSFSYTFDAWTSSGSCTDIRIYYNLVSILKKKVTEDDESYTDASSILTYTESTRSFSGSWWDSPSSDEMIKVEIEAVANDGRCTLSSFFIMNPCVDNELSKTGTGVGDVTYYLGDNTVTVSQEPFVSSTKGKDVCPIVYSYYIYNTQYNEWELQSSNSSPFTSFSTSTGDLDVYRASGSSAGTYTVKLVATDPVSTQTANSVEDTFDLTVIDPCTENTLTLNQYQSDTTYYLGSSTIGFSLDFDASESSCTIDYKLYFYDETNNYWQEYTSANAAIYTPVQSFSTSSGALYVYSDDFTNFSDSTIKTKLVATAPSSGSSVEDEFEITLKDQCLENTITGGITGFTGTENSPYSWENWEAQYVTFNPIDTSLSSCTIKYRVAEADDERTSVSSLYSVTDYDSYLIMYGVWTQGPLSTRAYYVIAEVYDTRETVVVASTEVKYWVKITDPCLKSASIVNISGDIADLDYWIGDAAVSTSFSPFTTYADQTYGATYGSNLCGGLEYTIYASDRFTPYNSDNYPTVTSYLEFEYVALTNKYYLTVDTDDVALYTNEWITFYVEVRLTDYYAAYPQYGIMWVPFQVRLKNCIVGDLTFDEVAMQYYNVYTPVMWIDVPNFVQVPVDTTFTKSAELQCGYTVTYEAKRRDFYNDVVDLPDFITWNAADRRFEVYSEDPLDADHTRVYFYKIQLTATISSSQQSPSFAKTLSFNLEVNNGCLEDQITANTLIDSYIYYLAEDTTTPDFIEGQDKPMDKRWSLTWDQSVEGCPVDYTIYVTDDEGVRSAIGAFEQAVIGFTSTETIPVDIPWVQQSSTFDPFDATIRVQSFDIATYDLQKWSLTIAMASTQSTHSAREGTTSFVLDLKDVCWDLPLTAPQLAAGNVAPQGVSQVTDLWFQAFESVNSAFQISAMNTQWGSYCDGFMYEVVYVAGDMEQEDGSLPDQDAMDAVFLIAGGTSTSVSIEAPDISWVGIHTLKIRGTNGSTAKEYLSIDSDEFTLEFIHPCTISVVDPVPIDDMFTTVLVGTDVIQEFTSPPDSQSEVFGDDSGYTFCGDRFIYVRAVEGPITVPDTDFSYVMPFFKIMTSETKAGDNPLQSEFTKFELILNAESQEYWDQYTFTLVVELADWPTSTPAVMDFKITINPCEVTSFEAPGDLNITYPLNVNSTLMTIEYTFAQSPCTYAGTFSAKMTNGTLENQYILFPPFITVYEDAPVMTIYANDVAVAGNYTIEICQELQNRYIWSNLDGVYRDEEDLDEGTWDADAPPSDLLYFDCFNVYVWMNSTEVDPIENATLQELIKDYVPPANQAPIMIRKPKDIAMYAGSPLNLQFGEPFDLDGDIPYLELEMGRAASFATFDPNFGILEIKEGATTNTTAGRYDMVLTVGDMGGLSTSYRFVLYIRYRPEGLDPNVATQSQVVVTADQIYPILTQEDFIEPAANTTTPVKIFEDFEKEVSEIFTSPDPGVIEQIATTEVEKFIDMKKGGPKASDEGAVEIKFAQKIVVPDNQESLPDREVAFDPRRRRLSSSRVETLLTDTGYVDFVIRPALEVTIVEEDSGKVRDDIDFTWKITKFTPSGMKIDLDFADPSQVSQTEPDDVVLTFWHGDLFILEESGEAIPNGFQIKTELPQQFVEAEWDDFSSYGQREANLLLIVFCVGLVLTGVCQGSFIPVFGLFETIQLISHLPLVNTAIPTRLLTFLKPINDLLRFDFDGKARQYFIESIGVDDVQSDYLNRRFRDFGYEGTVFLPNTIQIYVVFVGLIAICALGLLVEFMLHRINKGFKNRLLPQLISGIFRFLMLCFLEFVLCIWLHFWGGDHFRIEDKGDFLTSYWFALTTLLILVAVLFFACVQTCPRQARCGPACATFFVGLNERHARRSAIYPAFLLLRRVAIVVILGYLRDHPMHQLGLLLIMSCVSMTIIVGKQPFENKDHTFLQFFNELNVFLLTGLLIAFTRLTYNSDAEVAKIVSFIFMVDILLITAVNALFIVHTSIFGALHAHRVSKREKAIALWNSQFKRKRQFAAGDFEDSYRRGFVLQDKSQGADQIIVDQNHAKVNLADIVEEQDESSEYSDEEMTTPLKKNNNSRVVNQNLLDLQLDEGEGAYYDDNDKDYTHRCDDLSNSQIILLDNKRPGTVDHLNKTVNETPDMPDIPPRTFPKTAATSKVNAAVAENDNKPKPQSGPKSAELEHEKPLLNLNNLDNNKNESQKMSQIASPPKDESIEPPAASSTKVIKDDKPKKTEEPPKAVKTDQAKKPVGFSAEQMNKVKNVTESAKPKSSARQQQPKVSPRKSARATPSPTKQSARDKAAAAATKPKQEKIEVQVVQVKTPVASSPPKPEVPLAQKESPRKSNTTLHVNEQVSPIPKPTEKVVAPPAEDPHSVTFQAEAQNQAQQEALGSYLDAPMTKTEDKEALNLLEQMKANNFLDSDLVDDDDDDQVKMADLPKGIQGQVVDFNPGRTATESKPSEYLKSEGPADDSFEGSSRRQRFVAGGEEILRNSSKSPPRAIKIFKPIVPIPKKPVAMKIKAPAKPIPAIKDAYFGSKPVDRPKVKKLGANVGGFAPKKGKKKKKAAGAAAGTESDEPDAVAQIVETSRSRSPRK